jgi:preprotein translocase subunit SecG
LQEEEKDQEVLGITAVSLAPTKIVAGRGTAKVITRITRVVEDKTTLMLLLVLLLFLCLYYSYNKNTRKEK